MSRWTYTFKIHSHDSQQGNSIERDLLKEFDHVRGDFIEQHKGNNLQWIMHDIYIYIYIRHDMSYACERTQPS